MEGDAANSNGFKAANTRRALFFCACVGMTPHYAP
jgi:hypothetical protein